MARIAMLALKNFPFGGHNVRKGREFNAPSNMAARFLIEAGLADFAPAVLEAEPSAEFVSSPAAPQATSAEAPSEAAVELSVSQVQAIIARSQQLLAETEALPPVEQLPADYVPEVDQQPEVSADVSADVPADAPAQDEAADADISPRTGRPKRGYKRRDLTAEG